jgi:hypothetical protein
VPTINAKMDINKIIFTGDLLRISGDISKRNLIAKNSYWLHRVLHRQIKYATKKEIAIVEWETDNEFNGQHVFELFGLESNTENWSKLYFQKEIPVAVLGYFEQFFQNAIVIGFEISPFMMNVLSQLQIPCVNIAWDPVRFMDDIFFCFSTNRPEIFDRLLPYQLDELLIYQAADMQRARFMRQGTTINIEGTLVFGQTYVDRSLIEKNHIRELEEFESDLLRLRKKSEVFFKIHPFDFKIEQRKQFAKRLKLNLLNNTYNTYELFCTESIKHVAAISSGTTVEARFFDKSAETFMPTYYQYHQNTTVFDETVCIPIFDDFLHANFWADILSPFLKNTYTVEQKMAFKPNRMRQANCSFWGYQEPNNEQIAVKYDK